MINKISIIKKEEHKTSKWSGGTTAQLLIYPEEAEYGERNFKWRLSSAKVDDEESTFTYLPGISRIIMIIEEKLRLEHEGHHTIELSAFEQDSFKGEWTTKSYGKVTDFNLMMSSGCCGNLQSIILKEKVSKKIIFTNKVTGNYSTITDVFYIVKGNLEVVTELNKMYRLQQGDIFEITRKSSENTFCFNFNNVESCDVKLIRTSIYY
ncbi:HutD/Ves family protein [Brassicibacter mesophilus]|uniref:HutD/Ves family protein n=1 Tax=Brassicibacter mesophilus TaxID=745119 RepID=UPI003D24BF60